MSKENREKLRSRMLGNTYMLGKHLSEETKDKIRQHNSSPEHRAKLRKIHKGNKYCVGRKLSEETKRKIGLGVHLTYLKKKTSK